MEEWTTGVKTAVAAIILVLIIGIVMSFLYMGYSAAENSQDTMAAQTASLSEKIYSPYDSKSATGADILSAVEQFKGQDIGIVVQYSSAYTTVSGPKIKAISSWNAGSVYSYDLSSGKLQYQDKVSTLYNSANSGYVNPTAKYTAILCKNASGAVIGIAFLNY